MHVPGSMYSVAVSVLSLVPLFLVFFSLFTTGLLGDITPGAESHLSPKISNIQLGWCVKVPGKSQLFVESGMFQYVPFLLKIELGFAHIF